MTIISLSQFNRMIKTKELEERTGGYVPSNAPLGVQYGTRKDEIKQIAGKRFMDSEIAETGTCINAVCGPVIIFPCMLQKHIRVSIISKKQLDKLVEVGVVTYDARRPYPGYAYDNGLSLYEGNMYNTILGKRVSGILDGNMLITKAYFISTWMFACNFRRLLKYGVC